MIITHARHGRTRRDAANLAKHLMQADADGPTVVNAMVGLASLDLAAGLNAMRRLAPPGAAAFHHVTLSPGTEWNAASLQGAAVAVLRELGADPATHPHALVLHRKPGQSGRGSMHAHLVVAHWSGVGRGLDDGWVRLRLERLARELEWDHGDRLTPGRHDKALASALRRKGRSDIADALVTAKVETPLPRSVVRASARQAMTRQGIDDVAARAVVQAAWARRDGPAAFARNLTEAGLCVEMGAKPGVWIVATAAGVVIGALDRIVKQRRAEVAARMEKTHDQPIVAVPGVDRSRPEDRREDRTVVAPARTAGGEGGAVPTPGGRGVPDGDAGRAARSPGQPAQDRAGDLASSRRRIQDHVAATALAAAVSIPHVHAEAERRYLRRRLEELRLFLDQAGRKVEEAAAPLILPEAFVQAQLRADRSRQSARATSEAKRSADAKLAAIVDGRPKGLSAIAAWLNGRARRHRQEIAEAAQAAARAKERHEAADLLAAMFKAAAQAEAERAAAWRVQAAASRRQLGEVAAHEVALALEAARLLKCDPTLVSLSIPQLLWKADREMAQRASPVPVRPPDGPRPR